VKTIDGCIVWNEYNTVFGSNAICAQVVYFLHSKMRRVMCLRLSDDRVICRITYLQFPIQACFSSTSAGQTAQRRSWFTQYRTSDAAENFGIGFLYGAYSPCEWFWIDSNTVKMETRHHAEGSFGCERPAICNHYVVMAAWSCKMLKFCERF